MLFRDLLHKKVGTGCSERAAQHQNAGRGKLEIQTCNHPVLQCRYILVAVKSSSVCLLQSPLVVRHIWITQCHSVINPYRAMTYAPKFCLFTECRRIFVNNRRSGNGFTLLRIQQWNKSHCLWLVLAKLSSFSSVEERFSWPQIQRRSPGRNSCGWTPDNTGDGPCGK